METKLNAIRMERVRRRCGFFNGIDVAAEGSSGGLSLVWRLEIKLKHGVYFGNWGGNNRLPWLVGGDFNDILFAHEKKGGNPGEEARMEAFRRTLEDCSLCDISFSGTWFTWERGRILERNIRERLDRGVATNSWCQSFPNYSLRHLPHSFSNHSPLLIDTAVERKRRVSNRFRFESWWVLEETCEAEIRKIWEESSGAYLTRMRLLANGLREWGKKYNTNERVKLHLNMEMDKEERYWEQRAQVNWLQMGDKNTAFLHKSASQRRQINQIRGLQRMDGSVATNEREMEEIARKYFFDLFESKGIVDATHILSGVQPCISESMNQELLAPFIESEVVEALKGMGLTKAAGVDGFPTIFYQKYWHILGKNTSDFCFGVLNNGRSLEDINKTLVVLIPKTASPTNLKNFRPISLCTTIYKIITKSVANRLKKVLEECIDDSQSAFIPGRLITDNVLLAYEVLHSLKNKRTGRKGFKALKLDMSKAYGRVEWSFIEGIMHKLGFKENFVELIIRCLRSVRYSILINEKEGLSFRSTRGLRQGDPLSPYLFLFCGEGLSALMRLAGQERRISGAKVCRGAPIVTHLMFADDCILFGEASTRGVNAFKDILSEYEACSGQCVNFEKSTVFCSPNVTDQDKNLVVQVLGVQSSNDPESWSTKFISQGGKEVFIKAVLQAIPTYAMSCFLLPKALCSELENIMSSYWWNKNNGKRGMHWCNWKALSVSKEGGGMGFRDLNSFNVALLAKQGWRLLRYPNFLLARTLKAKYYKDSDFLQSALGNLPSLTWKSVWMAKGLLLQGMCWRIGDGMKISIWKDKWISGKAVINGQNPSMFSGIEKVADLIDSNTRKWNEELVRHTFTGSDAEKILCIPLSRFPHEDFVIWCEEPTGEFSVRSGHRLLAQNGQTQIQDNFIKFYRRLWGLDLPAKIKITVWRGSSNYLPNYSNLYYKRLMGAVNCRRCNMEEETREHLFRDCNL
ncbi:reverse transcriptase [Gossypium australe]|uniref:Reverse transcriptase n=1 Tax=Gossypium australe TaxID=47621 RepID=A0A5B6UI36_9ROSI|nr:reverse transcriptase [Gossypium australe]